MVLLLSTDTQFKAASRSNRQKMHVNQAAVARKTQLPPPFSGLVRGALVEVSRFTCTETVGLLRTGAQDGHLDFHTAPEP